MPARWTRLPSTLVATLAVLALGMAGCRENSPLPTEPGPETTAAAAFDVTVMGDPQPETGDPQGAVNTVTPSTNAVNKTNGWANVTYVDVGVGQVTLNFVSTRAFWSCFEYRIDDESPSYGDGTVAHYNTDVTDGLWNYTCQNNSSANMTLTASVHVDIRMVFGAERDERFDWTRFYVLTDDEAPITTNVLADPNPAAVGASVALTALVDDTDTGGSAIASAEYSLDGEVTWTPMTASDGTFDEVMEDVAATLPAPAEPGIYEVCVRGTDGPGNLGDSECTMFVVYDPSGGFVTGGGWIDSPDGAVPADPVPALVWAQGFEADTDGWFDINSEWSGSVTRTASGTGGIASASGGWHAVFEGDADSAPFSRFDGYRDTWLGTWTAEIDVYLDPSWPVSTGFDYSVAASGSDGNHQRDYIFHVNHDASTGMLLVAGSNNTNFAPREDLENINHLAITQADWYTLQHVFYEQGGALAVDLNVLDDGGSVLWTETRYNAADLIPAEVGGNRYAWFTFLNVPDGIAVDDHELYAPVIPAITGKATFGFVSKYKKGASSPDGNTEFQFKGADLNFHSTSYDWLVVNQAGENAQFKGEGTINGAGLYKFMLWAGDHDPDDPDTFRIKIWDASTDDVVYDNGMDQAIAGGNIVVHSGKKK